MADPDQPFSVAVKEGMVLIDGPNGVAITLTAAVARRTGEQLIAAAVELLAAEAAGEQTAPPAPFGGIGLSPAF